jgi:hypothetical protein
MRALRAASEPRPLPLSATRMMQATPPWHRRPDACKRIRDLHLRPAIRLVSSRNRSWMSAHLRLLRFWLWTCSQVAMVAAAVSKNFRGEKGLCVER